MQAHHRLEMSNIILKALINMNGVTVENIDVLGEAMATLLDAHIEIDSGNVIAFRTHCAWDSSKKELFLWA